MKRAPGDDARYRAGGVPARARPSEARAAAAARLAGAASEPEAVRRRPAEAAGRAPTYRDDGPANSRSTGRQARPAAPPPTDARRARPARPEPTDARRARPARPEPTDARRARRRQEAAPAARRAQPSPGPRRAQAIANPSAVAAGLGAAALAAPRLDPAPQEHSRPRHLKVVEPGTLSAAQRRRRARAVLIATIGAGTFIAFALVYLHVVLAQRQFRIDKLNTEVSKAQTSYQDLRLKVAELSSPQQIVSTAEGRLGMVQPTKVVYLTPPAPASSASGSTGQSTAGSGGNPSAGSPSAQSPAGSASRSSTKSQPAGSP